MCVVDWMCVQLSGLWMRWENHFFGNFKQSILCGFLSRNATSRHNLETTATVDAKEQTSSHRWMVRCHFQLRLVTPMSGLRDEWASLWEVERCEFAYEKQDVGERVVAGLMVWLMVWLHCAWSSPEPNWHPTRDEIMQMRLSHESVPHFITPSNDLPVQWSGRWLINLQLGQQHFVYRFGSCPFKRYLLSEISWLFFVVSFSRTTD